MDMRTLQSENNYSNAFPDSKDLRSIYLGPDVDASEFVTKNNTYGYQVELLSHLCLNGSFSDLSYEEWNNRCFPSHADKLDNVEFRRALGIWTVISFVIGLLGNLLTVVSVVYARTKHR